MCPFYWKPLPFCQNDGQLIGKASLISPLSGLFIGNTNFSINSLTIHVKLPTLTTFPSAYFIRNAYYFVHFIGNLYVSAHLMVNVLETATFLSTCWSLYWKSIPYPSTYWPFYWKHLHFLATRHWNVFVSAHLQDILLETPTFLSTCCPLCWKSIQSLVASLEPSVFLSFHWAL